MRNLSSKFRHEMYYNHTFDCLAEITLVNNTKLTLTNTELWTGGFAQDDSVSQDNSFTALGAAVIGSASVIINNMDESYSEYDFTNAKVNLSLSKTYDYNGNVTTEPIQMGVYTVDDTQYNGATITLSLLDNMEQFDRPYDTTLQYPATLITIVEDACLKCGVQLATLTFPHQEYEVQTKPDKDNVTYRQVISWAATIAGCFARCDAYGRLELKWFNTSLIDEHTTGGLDGGEFDSSTPYSTGDTANGGSFNPWNTGYVIDDGSFETVRQLHYLTRLFSQSIGVDDVVITGVRVVVEEENSTTEQLENKEYLTGTDDYVIEVSGNEFITSSTAQSISTWLGNQLIGLRFRNGSVTHINDPSIEAGDVAIVVDRKGREYPFLITRTSFSASGNQTTECNAESASRNSATQYSQATKAYVEARKLLNKEQSVREQAIQALSESLAQKSGLYSTVDTTQSGNIYYLHDKPLLSDSKIVWKMTGNAFGVTTDYNGEHPEQTVWNAGLTVDGTLIASIIDTIKISFSRGYGGTLTLGGQDNGNGWLKIIDDNGDTIGRWSRAGILVNKGSIQLGSSNNNPVFQVLNSGDVTAKSFTADDYVYVDGNSNSVIRIPYIWGSSSTQYTTLAKTGLTVNYANGNIYVGRTMHSSLSGHPTDSRGIPIIEMDYTSGSSKWDSYYSCAGIYLAKYTGSSPNNSLELSNNYMRLMSYDYNGDRDFSFSVNPSDHSIVINNCNAYLQGNRANLTVNGNFSAGGTKNRIVKTADYGERLLYCYETPTPMFGDVGEGVIGEDGKAYIQLDPTFLETVTTTQYQVFLQAYGDGKAYISERHESFFVVCGTPNLAFGWEVKARQRDYENYRLENKQDEIDTTGNDYGSLAIEQIEHEDYGNLAIEHIEDINKEIEVAA